MPVNLQLGIVWDPREPPPPEYQPPLQQHVIYHPPPPQQPEINDNPLPPAALSILHPLSTSLVAKVVHDTATVSVTQLFWNKTNSTIGKGTYSFPLPAGCTVVDFSCRVGSNRIVRGRVKPKLEAREAFNDAARREQTVTLLEQDTPEIFTTTLANIPAHTKLKAEITFITILKHKFLDSTTSTTLTIPTCIASRYDTPPELQHTQAISGRQNLSIQVEILAVEDITSIISKTHNLNVQMGTGTSNSQSWSEFAARRTTEDPRAAVVTLADRVPFLDRDFILDIMTLPSNGAEAPHACVETHPSFENYKAVMLTIPPKFMLKNESPVHDAEILFVADRSGSMEDKIESLKSAMIFFLKGIPQAQRFNVWCFGTNHTYLWPRSKKYSESTLQEALAYVSQQFRSDMGGTELLPALKAIVNARGGFEMTDVILLTDGQVWRLNETIDFIQQTRRTTGGRVRFFALGIGDAVSHELVEGIAKAGGGYAEVIPAASQGGWEDRLVAVLHASLTGHIGPLRIEFAREDGQEIEIHLDMESGGTRPNVLQSPFKISALSPFLQNRVFMLLDSANSPSTFDALDIKATTPNGQEVMTRVRVKSLRKKATTLHHLGARALLGDLERGQSWIHLGSQGPHRNTSEEQLARQEGERLGIKLSLVSKWTSFYAIEEPYEAPEHARDPFLDVDEPQIHHIAVNDLNLLRPRGHTNTNAVDTLRLELATPTEEQTEEKDESSSGSDSTDTEDFNHNTSDESGSDDDGAGGNGVPSRSAGQPRGPDSGQTGRAQRGSRSGSRNDAPQEDSNDGAAQEREQSMSPGLEYTSAYGNSTSTPDKSHSRVSTLGFGSPSTGNNSFIWAQDTHRGSLALPVPSPLSPPSSVLPLSALYCLPDLPVECVPPLSPTNSLTPIPKTQPSLWSSDKYTSDSKTSTPRSGHPSVSFKEDEEELASPLDVYKGKTRKSNFASVPESKSLPSQKAKRWSSSLFSIGRKSKSTKENTTEPHSSRIPIHSPLSHSRQAAPISKLESPIHELSGGSSDTPLISLPALRDSATSRGLSELSAESELGRKSCEKDSSFPADALPQVYEMSAPIHNPPASTAIFQTGTNAPKSAKDVEKEVLVRRLLALQNFDGSFLFTEDRIENFFGKQFRNAIHEIELNLHQISINQAEKYKIAVAIAVIVELEERYQSCKDLWLLIVEKARHFVYIWLREFGKERVFEFAKDLLASNNQMIAEDPTRETPIRDFAETKLAETTTSETKPGELHSAASSVSGHPTTGRKNSKLLKQDVAPEASSPPSSSRTRSSWRLGRKIQNKFQSEFEKTKSREATTQGVRRRFMEEDGSVPVNTPSAPDVPKATFERRGRTSLGQKSKTSATMALPGIAKGGQSLGGVQEDPALVL